MYWLVHWPGPMLAAVGQKATHDAAPQSARPAWSSESVLGGPATYRFLQNTCSGTLYAYV